MMYISSAFTPVVEDLCWNTELPGLWNCTDPDNWIIYDLNAEFHLFYESNYTNITPAYQIVSILDTEVIDQGESFSISFQIAGSGLVNSSLLNVYFPPNFLSTNDETKFHQYLAEANRTFDDDGASDIGIVWLDEKPYTHSTFEEGVTFNDLDVIFKQVYPGDKKTVIWGEKKLNKHSPIVLNVTTSNEASRGDKTIKVVLRYSDGEKWYITQDQITIHIRELYEYPEVLFLIAVAGLLGFTIITKGPGKIYNYYQNSKTKNENHKLHDKPICPICNKNEFEYKGTCYFKHVAKCSKKHLASKKPKK